MRICASEYNAMLLWYDEARSKCEVGEGYEAITYIKRNFERSDNSGWDNSSGYEGSYGEYMIYKSIDNIFEATKNGMLLGCAVADAFGAIYEGMSEKFIFDNFSYSPSEYIDYSDGLARFNKEDYIIFIRYDEEAIKRYYRYCGAHTDDTTQFILLMESENTVQFAKNLCKYDYMRGEGKGLRIFRKNMLDLLKTKNIEVLTLKDLKNLKLKGNAGNGSSMRAGAVAMTELNRWRDIEYFETEFKCTNSELGNFYFNILKKSIEQSFLTHDDIRAHLAASLIGLSTGLACMSGVFKMDPMKFHSKIYQMLLKEDSLEYIKNTLVELDGEIVNYENRVDQFKKSMIIITDYLHEFKDDSLRKDNFKNLVNRLAENSKDDRLHKYEPTGTLNFALESPITAYVGFLIFGTDYKEAVSRVISLGGDTDTVAAMTGQISGALIGFHELWIDNKNYCQELRKRTIPDEFLKQMIYFPWYVINTENPQGFGYELDKKVPEELINDYSEYGEYPLDFEIVEKYINKLSKEARKKLLSEIDK